MPKLISLYIRNVIIGFGIAAVFVGILLWFDVQNLRSLIMGSDAGLLALFMLWFMNGIVFAGVQFALAIMSLAKREDDNRHGGSPLVHEFRPIPVPAEKKQNHL